MVIRVLPSSYPFAQAVLLPKRPIHAGVVHILIQQRRERAVGIPPQQVAHRAARLREKSIRSK